jgi:hypothetical protein
MACAADTEMLAIVSSAQVYPGDVEFRREQSPPAIGVRAYDLGDTGAECPLFHGIATFRSSAPADCTDLKQVHAVCVR